MIRWGWRWGPAVLMMAAIFAASSIPDLQDLPANLNDKTAHFGAYGLLATLLMRALANVQWRGVHWRRAVDRRRQRRVWRD